jgi:O-antigen ligase
MRSPFHTPSTLAAMLAACTLPLLIAYNLTPAATLFNQLMALAGWGFCCWCLAGTGPAWRLEINAALLALGLLMLAALAAPLLNEQPWSMALSSLALLATAGLVLLAGMGLGASGQQRTAAMDLFCLALLTAGLLSVVVAVLQVFAPGLADGTVIARSGIPGRAVGNMRQPNHLASLLMWSCVAGVWLANSERGGRLLAKALPALLFALVFAVVLSASRTGMIGVALLALWGLLDRKLSKLSRWSLIATPLMLAASWVLVSAWAHAGDHAFGAESRLAEGAGSPSRLAILANAWALLKLYPLTGVGWGEFNLAWTMTPFPDRPTAFFDHTHNLPMQLLVELGWPLGLLVLGLLSWSIWRAFRAGQREQPGDDVSQVLALRCAFMVVLMIGLHSLLEYPLWYAYFLLPTAFALGLCLGGDPGDGGGRGRVLPAGVIKASGALLIAGCLFAVWDYLRVVEIYVPPPQAGSLESRIERGQRSVFFAAQADYAAATSLGAGPAALEATRRTAHHLIDVRLMMAWVKSLEASGDVDRARYVVQRLREFRGKQAEDWLAECELPLAASAAQPFQCQPASGDYGFREMR